MRDDFSFLGGAAKTPRPRWWVYAPILSPSPKYKFEVFALADHPWGAKLHWVEGRHLICRLTRDCGPCQAGVGRSWKGFLPAVMGDYKKRVIAAVTEDAAECLQQLRQRHGSIMHTSLLFERAGLHRTAPVKVSDTQRRPDKALLPPAFDVKPQVLCVHGFPVEAVIEILAKWQTFCENS
jgi:hypothetical protein